MMERVLVCHHNTIVNDLSWGGGACMLAQAHPHPMIRYYDDTHIPLLIII